MNRRGFLFGLGAALVAPSLPALATAKKSELIVTGSVTADRLYARDVTVEKIVPAIVPVFLAAGAVRASDEWYASLAKHRIDPSCIHANAIKVKKIKVPSCRLL